MNRMDAPAHILLIRLKSIGDVLFTLPAVHRVREMFPGASITFLTSSENAPLLAGFREVDEVFTLDRSRFRRRNPAAVLSAVFDLLRRLRGGKFSLAVDFQGYGETELFAWWSGAAQRWGTVYHPPRGWTYTKARRRDKTLHPAEWNLVLLAGERPPGPARNEFVLPAGALAEAQQFLAANRVNPARPVLYLQPFTSNPKKNWPLESALDLAQRWRERGMQVVFGGGPAERAALEPARAAGFVVATESPLPVSGALMKLSRLVVGADTGLLHLAVALGHRVVMLMRSNAPGTSHPFQHPDWALTPPEGKSVADIPVAAVMAAGERALSEPAGNVSC
jgi:ADP-heptose:LPS heptosyltransferase